MEQLFPKNDKRQWQCFCCGKIFLQYLDYKTHILDNHEEGREYIVCPLRRCGAPVRDIKAHMRARHPGEPLPKMHGPTRAIVWVDHGPKKNSKSKAKRPRFREGSFISRKMKGAELRYRSGMECEFYECLETLNTVVAYKAEPFSVEYFFEGESHQYHPDIFVQFSDGHIEVWEIKPGSQTAMPRNEAKWVACDAHCKLRNWQFVVMTEVGLAKLKKTLRQQLNERQEHNGFSQTE